MRGDLSAYDKLEIVKMVNGIGDRLPAEQMERYTQDLVRSFQGTSFFNEVRRTDEFKPAERPA
ncbi:MAG: hypothetical protein ACE5JI_20570, partial [Acidobacteriota bacterium]